MFSRLEFITLLLIIIICAIDFIDPSIAIKLVDCLHEVLHFIGGVITLNIGSISVSEYESYYFREEGYNIAEVIGPIFFCSLTLIINLISKYNIIFNFIFSIIVVNILLSYDGTSWMLLMSLALFIILNVPYLSIFLCLIIIMDYIILGH